MTEVITYRQAAQYDPSRTTSLRNVFARDMKRRFTELAYTVKKAVVDDDCFGYRLKTYQMTTPGQNAFAFPRSSEKVEAFMVWLRKQVDAGILDVRTFQQIGSSIEGAWTNMYIAEAYKRGLERARQEMRKAGYDVPTIDQTGGLDVAMQNIFHMDRVGLLFTRVFSDLKGITAEMDMQISRVLAQGMAEGDGMMVVARKLVATINGTGARDLGITDSLGRFIPATRRAQMLARTEMIRAYAESSLQEFKNWGVEGVNALAEFKTAGDDRVCPICESIDGKVFTIDEASGKIPVHPLCRCIWLPVIKE